ncbi:MAG: hypothetical protein KF869_13740 [Phycisphaeraceae bacterium]|nr:hypothetical protein [Phycisphaeraceae bacterium]
MRTRSPGLLLVLLCAAVASCGSPSAQRGASGPQDVTAAPVAGRVEPGIEVVAWSTDAPLARIAAALREVSRNADAPLPPEAGALWEAHGFRAYRVPVSQLERLRVAAGAPPRAVRNWLGQALVWTEAVGAPESRTGQTVALEAERLRLGPGRLRLLVRSWVAPEPGERGVAPVLHVELMPQHHDASRPMSGESLFAAPSIAATDQGQLFTRLWVRYTARSADEAVVLIAVPPGTDLDQLADSAQRAADAAAAGAPTGIGQVVRAGSRDESTAPGPSVESIGPGTGPLAATIPTIGEAMLLSTVHAPRAPASSDAAAEQAAARPPVTRRTIVVLVPRLPDGYTLLP